ncbi:hypothetical protein CR513_41908, partial [Mucuna pruriens]
FVCTKPRPSRIDLCRGHANLVSAESDSAIAETASMPTQDQGGVVWLQSDPESISSGLKKVGGFMEQSVKKHQEVGQVEENLGKLDDGLESMKVDSHSINAKDRSWDPLKSKDGKKMKKEISRCDENSSDERIVGTHERPHIHDIIKKNPWIMTKGKIPSFSGNGNADEYYGWELKNEISLQCKGLRKASIGLELIGITQESSKKAYEGYVEARNK